MKIEKNKMVLLHYTLKNSENEIIDSSEGSEPLAYLHGNGMLITGLEKVLEGKDQGEKLSVTVEPEEAYGLRSEELLIEVDRKQFEEDSQIEVGMQFDAGGRIVEVKAVNGDKITIDANHPLAGEKLFFDVEIVEVRDATPEELSPSCGSCSGGCGDSCSSEGCGCGGDCRGC